MTIVCFATAWGAAHGGINAFNTGLATGLAEILQPQEVVCAVTDLSASAVKDAAEAGVRLVQVTSCGPDRLPGPDSALEVVAALRGDDADFTIDGWLGHDIITGPSAVTAAARFGGKCLLVHHQDYLSYTNIDGGAGTRTHNKHEQQVQLFSDSSALLFGVGPWLAENAATLSGRDAYTLLPGFPPERSNRSPDASVRALLAGRFEAKNDSLKGLKLAAEAFGGAVKSGHLLPTLEDPRLVVLGADAADVDSGKLELLVNSSAGRPITVVPASFNPNPEAVYRHLSHANLAILPSRHEGFGLIGWEAIGAGVPLILGRRTGLLRALETLLGGPGVGCVHAVEIDGSARELPQLTDAIIKVARDIKAAKRNALQLRAMLKASHGCTWVEAAGQVLNVMEGDGGVVRRRATANQTPVALPATFASTQANNHFLRCVELTLSAGQGATAQSFELITELRFGVEELTVDGVESEIYLKRIRMSVTPDGGKVTGDRLGDQRRPMPGLEARAGGVWVLQSADGDRLLNKVLGNDALCTVTGLSGPIKARVEVTASKRDIGCDIKHQGRRLEKTTERVMATFLKQAIMKEDTGHVLLSEGEIDGGS